jgi:subtilisin family serine protease
VPSSLFLVKGLPSLDPLTLSLLGVSAVELDLLLPLKQATVTAPDGLSQRTPMSYYGTVAWEGYLVQPAGGIIRLADTHCGLEATGAGIVAVIDSGIDAGHPTLQPVLAQGWDFTRDVAGGDEMADLGQASVAVRDGAYRVNQSSVAVLDQASVALLDDQAHVAFGHGTMVAGIVHLAAPTAQIMPLKAFHADGQGYTSDILRAIYYATWKGAKILNMSFSSPTSSPEIGRALYYATSQGLVSVASVGNDGSASLVYPAAFGKDMGVASTSNDGTRSSFSNYGAAQVWVAAPGEGIITTYPWSSYAAGWGTSFSTPFVSGAAALLVGMEGTADYDQVSQAVSHANPLTSDLGYGRLDLYQAVLAGRALWPGAPPSPVPGTCSSLGVDWSPAP